MRALGFSQGAIAAMVISETLFLLVLGELQGALAAIIATAPTLFSTQSEMQWGELLAILLLVMGAGFTSCFLALHSALRKPVIGKTQLRTYPGKVSFYAGIVTTIRPFHRRCCFSLVLFWQLLALGGGQPAAGCGAPPAGAEARHRASGGSLEHCDVDAIGSARLFFVLVRSGSGVALYVIFSRSR